MAGVDQPEMTATEADRKQRLSTQKTASDKERIQRLDWLTTVPTPTLLAAAARLGHHRVTLQEW